MGTFRMQMDDDFKEKFSEVCHISTVVTMLGTKMIRERRIPFEICADPFYSKANAAHLKRSIAQLEAGRGKVHDLIAPED